MLLLQKQNLPVRQFIYFETVSFDIIPDPYSIFHSLFITKSDLIATSPTSPKTSSISFPMTTGISFLIIGEIKGYYLKNDVQIY